MMNTELNNTIGSFVNFFYGRADSYSKGILIEKVAQLNFNGFTPLIVACVKMNRKVRNREVVQVLLDHSIRDGVVKSALDWACEEGHDEIVDLLLSHVPVYFLFISCSLPSV